MIYFLLDKHPYQVAKLYHHQKDDKIHVQSFTICDRSAADKISMHPHYVIGPLDAKYLVIYSVKENYDGLYDNKHWRPIPRIDLKSNTKRRKMK